MVNEDLLRQLFVKKSLKNNPDGFECQMKNSLSDATIVAPIKVVLSSEAIGKETYKDFTIDMGESTIHNQEISEQRPAPFVVGSLATLKFKRSTSLPSDKYKIRFVRLLTEEYGDIPFAMKERIRD
ncbi:MAG: hypothetical protein ACFFE8_15170 [Candidatus Heimdallarchaeota archaeon]